MSFYKAVTLVGPPGSGKGTVGKRLADKTGLVYLATGDLVRAEVAARSELADTLIRAQQKGELVSDDIIVNMLFRQLGHMIKDGRYDRHRQRLLLDGVPRTYVQVAMMGDVEFEQALQFKLSDEIATERILGRAQAEVDAGREPRYDDTPEAIPQRLRDYRRMEEQLLIKLEEKDAVISEIDASQSIDAVLKQAADAVRRVIR